MADTSLIFSIIARDRTSAVLNRLESRTAAFGRVAAAALGPAIAPIAGVSAAAVVSLGSAFAGAGAAIGVFKAVATSAMGEVKEAATQAETLQDKIEKYGAQAKVAAAAGMDNKAALDAQAKATMELKAHMASLPPDVRKMTESTLQLKSQWQGFVDANKPAVFALMTKGYGMAGRAIGQLQPLFDMGAAAAGRLLDKMNAWVSGGGISRIAATAGPALDTLTSIILNVGTAVGKTFGKIGAAQGQGILEWIENLTAKWAQWASATDADTGINKFIDYITANGPQVASTLQGFGTAALHVAQAVTPLAPVSLAIAGALAAIVSAIPSEWITAIVAGFLAFNVAMRLYALGTAVATAAQWAMNSALLANPITWVVAAVVALIAVIVLVATKTKFFQTVWGHVWGFMKSVGAWFAGPFANFFVQLWNKITSSLGRAKNQIMSSINSIKSFFLSWHNRAVELMTKIVTKGMQLANWFRALPGRIGGALRNVWSGLWSGFRTVVNRIIAGWNRLSFTVGGGSFMGVSIPSVTIGTPNLPYLDTGGRILKQGIAMLHRGEEVHKPAVVSRTGQGTGSGRRLGPAIVIKSDGSRLARLLLETLRESIRDQGGDVVKVLTPR